MARVAQTCINCRFFQPQHFNQAEGAPPEATAGECRARAPVIGTGQWADQDCAPYAYWPGVVVSHWCGFWKVKQALLNK